jgi:transcriptional regulator with XRE-family HTH domain
MNHDIQTIRTPNGEELVVMPRALYEELIDTKAAREAKAALASGEEELLSAEEVQELLASPSPLAFWRRKRNRRQDMLAEVLGTSQGYISDIENGRRKGGIKFYQRAAMALDVPLGAILPADEEDHEPDAGVSPEFAPEGETGIISAKEARKRPIKAVVEGISRHRVARNAQTGEFVLRAASRKSSGKINRPAGKK